MLDLAISIHRGRQNVAIVETNHGLKLRARGWPQDCEFQLVGFLPSGRNCEVVSPEGLAADIDAALLAIDAMRPKGRKPDWYRRLRRLSARIS